MAIHRLRAFVLRRVLFRETSLIITAYAEGWGKLQGLVKGIRGDVTRYGSRLEPMTLNELVFYEKRSGLHLISQCALLSHFPQAWQELETITRGQHCTELVLQVTEDHAPNDGLFQLLHDAFRWLGRAPDLDRLVRVFEVKLLALAGVMPRLDACVLCQQAPQGAPRMSARLGGLLCQRCHLEDRQATALSRETLTLLHAFEHLAWPQAIQQAWSPPARTELMTLLDTFLRVHVQAPLRVREIAWQAGVEV